MRSHRRGAQDSPEPAGSLDEQRHTTATSSSGPNRPLRWILAAALLILALGFTAIEVTALFWQPERGLVPYFGDLGIYRSAISYWLHGGGLYDYAYTNPHVEGPLGFTYPPFAALVLLPTAWVPVKVLATLWTASTYTLVALLALTFAWTSGRGGPEESTALDAPRLLGAAALGYVLLVLSYPVFHDIGVGETSLTITALPLFDSIGILPRRARGVLTGIAAAVKLTPLVFIPYFLVSGRRREALLASGTFSAAMGLAFALTPSTSLTYWGSVVMDTSRVGQVAWSRNKSLMGLLARWGASGQALLILWFGLGLALAIVALHRARRHAQRGEFVEAALVMGALSVTVSPISWPHHQTWAVLVAIWLVLTRRPALKGVGVALFAIFSLVSPLAGLVDTPSLGLRLADELPSLAFIGISVLGLGHRRADGRRDRTPEDGST